MSNGVVVTTTTATVHVTEDGGQTTVVETASNATVISVITEGPQGPSGIDAGALPAGGNPGNILIKNSNANYDTVWVSTLDGGTFF